jgi:hypothetical protein
MYFIWVLLMFAKVFKCFSVQKHVASVCFKCFTCFKYMLQVFYLNVTYVAVATHICCKAYVLNVLSVLDVCCSKFSMLQVFHGAQAIPVGAYEQKQGTGKQ